MLGLLAAAPSTALAQFGGTAPPGAGATPRGYFSVGAGAAAYRADCGGSRSCARVGSAVRGAAGWFFSPDLGASLRF